jgi:processive 1,2-diacylglycerol beta-glucosyltransferase
VAAALEQTGARVVVRDHFHDFVHPAFARATRALYAWVLRRAPLGWALAYELGDRLTTRSALTFGATSVGMTKLGRYLAIERPDAVVTVHATPAVAMSALVAEGGRVPPHTTVVTDFVAHAQWIAPRIDRYCVAATEVANDFVARGIPRDRIRVTGVPVGGAFDEPTSQADARAALGLTQDVPIVLAMAGSDGSLGRLADVTATLAGLPRHAQVVVVTGRNEALARRLRHSFAGSGVRILSWTLDVRTLMAAADVLVTKAGGMTLAEALAAELPVVLYGSLPGQERRNEDFAARAGIALLARSRRELAGALDRVLTDVTILERLRERIRSVRRPTAAATVARTVLAVAREACASPEASQE